MDKFIDQFGFDFQMIIQSLILNLDLFDILCFIVHMLS